jgi:hypothetical protein
MQPCDEVLQAACACTTWSMAATAAGKTVMELVYAACNSAGSTLHKQLVTRLRRLTGVVLLWAAAAKTNVYQWPLPWHDQGCAS